VSVTPPEITSQIYALPINSIEQLLGNQSKYYLSKGRMNDHDSRTTSDEM
jgi:hypothetical protein